RILDICARNLAHHGVALVSYNTYPGWHLNGMVRELIGYHARRFPRPEARAAQARALLDFLPGVVSADSPYGPARAEAGELFRGVSDAYGAQDHREEGNEPLYFHQFVERAAAKGLQYLAEAEVGTMVPGLLRPEVARTLRQLSSDTIELEQFLDFL